MCLWSLHPKYRDRAGLTAVWREAPLAQQVLRCTTRGYRHHPQLARFRAQADPLGGDRGLFALRARGSVPTWVPFRW